MFGMGVLEYPIGKPHPTLSIFYSCCWVLLYYSLAALSYPDITELSGEHTSVKILFFSQVLITIVTIAVNWIKCTVSVWNYKNWRKILDDLTNWFFKDLHPCVIRSAVVDKLIDEWNRHYERLPRVVENSIGKTTFGSDNCFIFHLNQPSGYFITRRFVKSKNFDVGGHVLFNSIDVHNRINFCKYWEESDFCKLL